MSTGVEVGGIVLSSTPSAEYDRRVVLLTRERGKITAFARGARRSGSSMMAATSPMCMGNFTVYEGRNAYTMVHAQISHYFEELRSDVILSCYGMCFLELADYYGRENLDAADMLNLLYVSLRTLSRPEPGKQLVRYVYEIRLMQQNGEYPMQVASDGRLSETARYALNYIFQAPLKSLYAFTLSEEVMAEISTLQDGIRSRVIDRRLKALEVLEALEQA